MDNAFQLCQLLCGDFCNREQAFNNPPIYAHIQVRIRALPHLEPGSLLLEQAYTVAPNEPYRIRVLQVVVEEKKLRIVYKDLMNSKNFIGATLDQIKLREINSSNLNTMEGCALDITYTEGKFIGAIEPGCKCIVERNKTKTYLQSQFYIDNLGMRTWDQGFDIETKEVCWGSLAGPFEFKKHQNPELKPPDSWQNAWE
ncbi:MAG: chromophore lyase CpcT/CpeT [Synechococcus sp. LacPavin_0920_WC12_MAG_50_7]|nr:chromophore lyase CpcT/CpeT [Synechococcus sp. LacPavin_0920_WC12_MAG_50_7]